MEVISVVMLKVIGALLLTISLIGCSSTPYYADRKIDTYNNYKPVTSLVGLVYNLGKSNAYSVPKGSRLEHENCVMMILDNGNAGETCRWHTNEASGSVLIARIRPNLCHDIVSTVNYKGKSESWTDTACPTRNNKWKFYDR